MSKRKTRGKGRKGKEREPKEEGRRKQRLSFPKRKGRGIEEEGKEARIDVDMIHNCRYHFWMHIATQYLIQFPNAKEHSIHKWPS